MSKLGAMEIKIGFLYFKKMEVVVFIHRETSSS